MKKNHVPAMSSLTALVVFLVLIPKQHGNFTPKGILYALGFAIMIYVYANLFELGQGK
jgi:peptidoglycan/LPS O-acetylase OafA/YrhL